MRGRFWTILLDIRLTLGPFSGGLFSPFHALLSQLLLDGGRSSCLCSPFLSKSRVWVKFGILDGERLVLKKNHLYYLNSGYESLDQEIRNRFLTWSTLISLRARDMPCCTSGHCSFSSFNTSLVSRGVGGTALYCWKENPFQRWSWFLKHLLKSTYSWWLHQLCVSLQDLFSSIPW